VFKRVLIANRGEIAARVIRACQSLGIETAAVFSEADRASPHLAMADLRASIGPGPSKDSYLNREALLHTALNLECQAVHPGFGFLAEDPLFAFMCEQQKLSFIGPPAHVIRLMGDKSQARTSVRKSGLSPIPGSSGNLRTPGDARKLATSLGYPVMLKATAGGGGKGIRPCRNEAELDQFFPEARLEAEKAFGNPAVYMEKMLVDARHIEFQVLADNFGNVVSLGERECSLQRSHQKLIEESPSPAMNGQLRTRMNRKICSALKEIGYRNAGTMEFLMDQDVHLYFMEMNTRLQVEHPVTEEIYGVDIVREQIRIAANHPLSITQRRVSFSGHAIECRINAEDPYNNFQPSPGRITSFAPPGDASPGRIRLETHVSTGYEIPPYYDSMICKLIAWGEDRPAAIATMENALKDFEIKGIKTTIPLHRELLRSHEFRSGDYHINTLKKLLGGGQTNG
jgi:acetyl-CoA carboxylase biotin carboxylase subunit